MDEQGVAVVERAVGLVAQVVHRRQREPVRAQAGVKGEQGSLVRPVLQQAELAEDTADAPGAQRLPEAVEDRYLVALGIDLSGRR